MVRDRPVYVVMYRRHRNYRAIAAAVCAALTLVVCWAELSLGFLVSALLAFVVSCIVYGGTRIGGTRH